MDHQLYLDLLNLTCIGLLGWGLIRPERTYQFPFFMGAIFVSFILPQAIALRDTPTVVTPEALSRVLLMTILCAAMCWIGYQFRPTPWFLTKLNINLDEQKLFRAGIVLLAIAYFSIFLLTRITIQTTSLGTWQGPATILFFFSNVIYIAFGIFLIQTLKYPKLKNLVFTVLASLPVLQAIILSGRRQPTIAFLVVIGFSFWFVLRYLPPRWCFILATIGGLYLIPLFGDLRGGFWELVFSGDWQALFSSAQQSFDSLLEGDILELRNAALMMDAAVKTNQFGYGTGFWDAIVFQYVPGQIVGYGFKASLQFRLTNYDLGSLYGYTSPSGATVTAIGDTFVEFYYFGCLLLALIAYLFKHLWISAVYQQSTVSALLYMGLISSAMIGITHGIGRFCQEVIFQVFFVGVTAYFSRVRTQPDQMIFPHYGDNF
ncbi:MAG: hypothetical protein KME11_20690 [Timaviella obliquedivisa GSE-PSE-MK23-08B]|jgi:hypothetical protein|nr:hypothetical protein [Timaviella obliquedivisa GSE-PSE-MK23-08B]